MVFDGDCNFCGLWIRRWRQLTGDTVDYLPSQDPQIATQFPEIPREHFQTSVQLIEPDGKVFSGVEAVFRALANNPKMEWPFHLYESSPAVADITEYAYKFIANHRTGFSYLTRLLWGKHVEQPDYFLTRWIFLRALGVIYLIAFISLWTQMSGLIGHNGILPEDQYISAVKQQCDAQGIGLDRFRLMPTLCWLNSSDGFLQFQCAAGVAVALLLIFGIAPAPALALLWLLYLSLMSVGRDFLGFQWDNLLLETGFLSIFFAPLRLLPNLSREPPPSRIVLWLLRVLLFKLMFSSGCVKLASGDQTWRNFTALTFHYQTQPLPTWIGWYASQSPLWCLKSSLRGNVCHRIGCPVPDFRTATTSLSGRRSHCLPANPDFANRQLHLFQFPDARIVPVAAGRLCAGEILATALHSSNRARSAASLEVCGHYSACGCFHCHFLFPNRRHLWRAERIALSYCQHLRLARTVSNFQ